MAEFGKIIKDEAMAHAGKFLVSASAWVYPPSYQKMCEQLMERDRGPQPHEHDILRGLGELMLLSARGVIDVEKQHVRGLIEAVHTHLHEDIGYHHVVDPHKAQVLQTLAPLDKDKEK